MFTPETSPLLCLGCQNIIPPDPPDPATGQTRLKGICPMCEGPLQLCMPGTPATVFPLPDGRFATQEQFQQFLDQMGVQQPPGQPSPQPVTDVPVTTTLPPSPPRSAPSVQAGEVVHTEPGIDRADLGNVEVAGDVFGDE